MASTNKTQVFQLNQFIGTDSLKRVDYNGDMEKIENALKASLKNGAFSNGRLTLTKGDNTDINLTLFEPISNDNRGITSFDEIKQKALEKIQEFGIGLNKPIKKDMNSFLSNGLYSVNSGENRIRGKSTSFLNFQYDTDWGVQLGLTEEDNPTVNVRSKRDGVWNEWKRLVDEPRLNEILESKRARLDDIWAGV
ncbi:pyocin knob domain-containing protein [Streptobacillus canis]|uniref:pyocin knob domain-containing protein n=1 Tax=Streptobacillus canis TaxID=2678686 RepID=UPI0012E14862|nr:pyocin knob domain-containing protein [Streptobacillus canis]